MSTFSFFWHFRLAERDFVNPMRVLLLSFPPDVSEDMRDAQFRFEKAANKMSKATAGYRRDLPVEVTPDQINSAKAGWDEGRIAINEFFVLLNKAVGLDELTTIPPAGPNQYKAYGRSPRRYNELQKKIKLCQNRGGPALSQAWGESLELFSCSCCRLFFFFWCFHSFVANFSHYSFLLIPTQDNSWYRVIFRTVVEFQTWTTTLDKNNSREFFSSKYAAVSKIVLWFTLCLCYFYRCRYFFSPPLRSRAISSERRFLRRLFRSCFFILRSAASWGFCAASIFSSVLRFCFFW